MHANSNQIESLWNKYLFSYSPAVYNTGDRLYKHSAEDEEFLLKYRTGQHMLDIGNP